MIALFRTPERRLLLIALAVRIVPAMFVFGTEDVSGSIAWAEAINRGASPYSTPYLLPWPPLWPFVAWIEWSFADATWIPVSFALKSIPIAVDVVTTFVLYGAACDYGLPPMRTAILYALNPVAVYACALHGNFDAIPAMCALQAVVLAGRGQERPAAAWLGAGGAFKTWPLLLLPAFVAAAKTMRRRAEVAAIAVVIFAAALLMPVPFTGWHVLTDAMHYHGTPEWWGLGSLSFLFHVPIAANIIFAAAMTAAALLLFATRPAPAIGALLILLTFLATTPGFGVQYLVWIVPIAMLADQRRGVAYSLIAGAVLAWEIAMRPYTGHHGDVLRLLPHADFKRSYGHGADHLYTAIDRLAVWAFVCYWWVVTIARASREGRRGPSYTKPV